MKKLIYTSLTLLILTGSISAQVLWKSVAGPTGGSTNSLSVDSLGRIYVCTGGDGVLQSTDQGVTWHGFNKGLRILPMRWVESSTLKNSIGGVAYLYGLSHRNEVMRRVFSTTSSDVQWEYLDSIVGNKSTLDIHQLMTNAKGYFYLATAKYGVVRSRDNGAHFDPTDTVNPAPMPFIQCMAVASNQYLYAVGDSLGKDNKTYSTYVFRSTNDGDSWERLPTQPPNGILVNKMVVADDGSIILGYLNIYNDLFRVARSSDGGNTWVPVLSVPPTREASHVDVMRHATRGSDLYINVHGPTYRSTDNGATWVLRNEEKMGDETFDLVQDSIGIIYQCAIPDGIFRSLDSGLTFSDITNRHLSVQHLDGGVAVNSKGDVFCASQFNAYRSTNQGISWEGFPNELDEGQSQLIVVDHQDNIYYNTSLGLYRSKDNGHSFDTVIKPDHTRIPENAQTNQVYYMAVSPKDEIFVSAQYDQDGKGTPYYFMRSKDHGDTWKRINNSGTSGIPPYLQVYAVGFSTTDPHLDDTIYVAGSSNNIYRSINDGVNWDVVNTDGNSVSQILCHPDGSVFRCETRYEGGIFRSQDGGYNWKKVFPPDGLFIPGYSAVMPMMLDRLGRLLVCTFDVSPTGPIPDSLAKSGFYLSQSFPAAE